MTIDFEDAERWSEGKAYCSGDSLYLYQAPASFIYAFVVIMVIIHTGWKQQVREISNAIAFLFVARDSVICYLVRLEGNPARENLCMHTEI